ncbi:hypothetical protein GCM10009554_73000 [Kribbella koreensis]|uniref:Uncharacterized protein n=2 Tax=Kribbella TaxID=182639 RepID=A0ABP6YXC9_9ACTN
MVMMTGSLAVRGTVVWLTPQQGGRVSGPPEPDYDYDYTATAYLPPRSAEDGQAGLSLRRFAPGAWRTPAEGILVPPKGHRAQQVVPGNIVVITEGIRPVGLLTVEEVHALAPDGSAVIERAPEVEITGLTAIKTPDTDAPYRHSTAATRWSSHERAGAS